MGQSIMGNIQTMNRKIGIIDCNNFYVSCERLFNPESVGRPTVVLSNNDGCVIARSQEAKKFGIKMGEPFFQKKEFMEEHRFCVYSSNYNLYGDMSDRVMSIIKNYAKVVEVYSIDESFVDFSDIPDDELNDTLQFIKEEVKRKTGIPVSIGVGPNKTLAKLTSHMAKQSEGYNGVCSYWELKNFRNMMYQVDVSEIWGIGRKWSKKLNLIGVETIGQFMNMSSSYVKKLMNINGVRTQMELMGEYCHPVKTNPKPKKNIASTRSFGEDVGDFNQIADAMYSYIESGVKKLYHNGLNATKSTIFVTGNKYKGENHQSSYVITFQEPTQSIQDIWSQIHPFLKDICQTDKTYKKCGIIFQGLVPSHIVQTSLFVEDIKIIDRPKTTDKKWHMKQEYITQKYTTSWDELPLVFV